MIATDTVRAAPEQAADGARAFLAAVMARDLRAMAQNLDEAVWLRVLQPRSIVEVNDATAVLAKFHEWFVTPSEIELLTADHDTIEGRERVTWRFQLRPTWAPDTWHVIEQTGYARVVDGRIRRLDLVCTGFHPVD